MKYPPILVLLGLLIFTQGVRAEDKPAEKAAEKAPAKAGKFKWYTSIKQARKAAAEEKKPVIMLFTGSDWCPYCVKLEKEILSHKDFKDWATKNAILYLADSKGGPGHLSPENKKMMSEYGVGGYPSVIITDSEGTKTGKTGYFKTSPAQYVKQLELFIKPASPASK